MPKEIRATLGRIGREKPLIRRVVPAAFCLGRVRTDAEIDSETIAGCCRLGEIGIAADTARSVPDYAAVADICKGLRGLLNERRAREP